jgi:hypothetical protein
MNHILPKKQPDLLSSGKIDFEKSWKMALSVMVFDSVGLLVCDWHRGGEDAGNHIQMKDLVNERSGGMDLSRCEDWSCD